MAVITTGSVPKALTGTRKGKKHRATKSKPKTKHARRKAKK